MTVFGRLHVTALIFAVFLLQSTISVAQTRSKGAGKTPAKPAAKVPPKDQVPDLSLVPPFRVDARIYQARSSRPDAVVDDQVFRLTTANLLDEENWINAFAKVYPGFEFGLIQSAQLRVYRSAKPTRLTIGRSDDRVLELLTYGAHSLGDGTTPGTSLVAEVDMDFGTAAAVALSIQSLEVEEGKTYFFALSRFRLKPSEYVRLLRPGQPVRAFVGKDTFLVVSLSVQLNPAAASTRNLDEARAAEMQASALKKVQPEIPAELRPAGLGGKVRVVIEVASSGRVTHAYILNSTYPEMNVAAINAARQWEFSTAEFAQDPRSIASVLVFDFPTAAPAK